MRKVELTVKNMLRYKSFGYFFRLIKLIIYFIKVDKKCHKWLVGVGPFPEQPSVLDCNEFHARNFWIPYSTFL